MIIHCVPCKDTRPFDLNMHKDSHLHKVAEQKHLHTKHTYIAKHPHPHLYIHIWIMALG